MQTHNEIRDEFYGVAEDLEKYGLVLDFDFDAESGTHPCGVSDQTWTVSLNGKQYQNFMSYTEVRDMMEHMTAALKAVNEKED